MLPDVVQLMGDEVPPGGPLWRVAFRGEHDVASYGVGLGAEGQSGPSGPEVGMDSHVREIVEQAGFELCPKTRVEGVSRLEDRLLRSSKRLPRDPARDVGVPGGPLLVPPGPVPPWGVVRRRAG